MSLTIVTAYHVLVEKFQPLLIHPDVSVLPGLHLQVVLAVHGVVDHQLSCLNVVRHVENIKTPISTTIITASHPIKKDVN